MKIELTNVSKRFNYDWIFRDINYTFESAGKYAITGRNGSGKSTLLRIISGQLTPSEGIISYSAGEGIDAGEIYRYISFAAPYLELMDDFTLDEAVRFHSKFKPFTQKLSIDDIETIADLQIHRRKYLREFSSGMRQRVKLILSVLSDSQILLLDEPTTNLDEAGVKWYLDLISKYCEDKLVIVCSNQEREYGFCTSILSMQDYKSPLQIKP